MLHIEGAHIVMDTRLGSSIYVYLSNGPRYEFKQFKNGLYYFDTSVVTNNTNPSITNYSLLQTVKDNKQYFTNNEIKGADLSRKYQEYLFYPGTKSLNKYVANNLITNSEITVDDVNRGELIYGPPVPYVQGHMVRTKPPIHNKYSITSAAANCCRLTSAGILLISLLVLAITKLIKIMK